jgi:hypothetical protein
MKKIEIILGLATVALLVAGCAENSTTGVNPVINDDPNTIGFEMGTGKATRATDNTLITLQNDQNGFGVFATNGRMPVDRGEGLFINNEVYVYNKVTGEWQWKKEDILWPQEASMYPINFYAHYPIGDYTMSVAQRLRDFTIADVANQVDYLAAKKEGVSARPANSKVTLDFKHILSKIDFKLSVGMGTTVEVQSVAVKQVSTSGQFNYQRLGWNTSGGAVANYYYMTAPVVAANIKSTTTEPVAITSTYGSMMLIPDVIAKTPWDGLVDAPATGEDHIEVVYRVYETNGGEDVVGYTDAENHPNWASTDHPNHNADTHPDDGTKLFIKVAYPLSTFWEMGKAYTYILHLGDPNYSGGQLIEDFYIDEEGNVTDLPVEPYDIPDIIYPDNWVIGFDVVVSDWADAGSTDL